MQAIWKKRNANEGLERHTFAIVLSVFYLGFRKVEGAAPPISKTWGGATFSKIFLVYYAERCFLLVQCTLSTFLLFLCMFGAFLVLFRFVYALLTVLAGTRKNDGPELVSRLSTARVARRKFWNILLKSIKKPTKMC